MHMEQSDHKQCSQVSNLGHGKKKIDLNKKKEKERQELI